MWRGKLQPISPLNSPWTAASSRALAHDPTRVASGRRACRTRLCLCPPPAPLSLSRSSSKRRAAPACCLGLMILQVPVRILVNVGVMKINLVMVNPCKGIADLAFARPQRLNLRALQHDARLESVEDVIVAPGFGLAH